MWDMRCAKCDRLTVGKSKYCQDHRAIARQEWKMRIEASASERAERVDSFGRVLAEARECASRAYVGARPTPMVVYETVGLSDVPKPGGNAWEVSEGLCGFAWVHFPKANTSFVRWLAKNGVGRRAYGGGWDIQSWDLVKDDRSQSVERKSVAMREAVEVFRRAGLDCYAEDRLD